MAWNMTKNWVELNWPYLGGGQRGSLHGLSSSSVSQIVLRRIHLSDIMPLFKSQTVLFGMGGPSLVYIGSKLTSHYTSAMGCMNLDDRCSRWKAFRVASQRGRKEDCDTVVQFGLSRKQRLKTYSCELLQSDNVGVCLPIVSMMSTNSKAPRFSLVMMLRPLRLRIKFSFPRRPAVQQS